jgi:hypothetical protein
MRKGISIAKGPKYPPHNQKGTAKKYEGPEELAAEIYQMYQTKGQDSCLGNNLLISRDEYILTHLYFHIHLQFISFSAYFFHTSCLYVVGNFFLVA